MSCFESEFFAERRLGIILNRLELGSIQSTWEFENELGYQRPAYRANASPTGPRPRLPDQDLADWTKTSPAGQDLADWAEKE